jgi:hypothetical protein
MANALRAGFQRVTHRMPPVPVGSKDRVTRYRHFSAACSVGKWPRAFTALRYRALRDSIALVPGMKVGERLALFVRLAGPVGLVLR